VAGQGFELQDRVGPIQEHDVDPVVVERILQGNLQLEALVRSQLAKEQQSQVDVRVRPSAPLLGGAKVPR